MTLETHQRVSLLAAPAADVWAHATSIAGIQAELSPWLRMTVPTGARGLDIASVRPPERLGRSWLLLLRVLPVEYDDLTIAELEPGRRFLERSTMLTLRRWIHERTVEPAGAGCCLTDTLRFEARLGFVQPIARLCVRGLFGWRHRQLRRRFGVAAGASASG